MEVLSQEEIKKLLDAINGEGDDDDYKPAEKIRRIMIYDFNRPTRFTKEQMNIISRIHENIGHSWSKLFSQYLKEKISIKLGSVDDLTFDEIAGSFPVFTSLIVTQVSVNYVPIPFPVIIEIDPHISREILFYLFHGKSDAYKKYIQISDLADVSSKDGFHELTILEQSAMSYISKLLLENYSKILSKQIGIDVDIQLQSIETSIENVNSFMFQELNTFVTYKLKTPNGEGIIDILLPYQLIKLLLSFLPIKSSFSVFNSCLKNKNVSISESIIDSVLFTLKVECFRKTVCFEELNDLRKGDVLYAPYSSGKNNCKVIIDNYVLCKGEINTDDPDPGDFRKIIINDFSNPYEEVDMVTDRNTSTIEESLDKLKLQVIVELGRTVKTLKDVKMMKEGEIVELNASYTEPVNVFANNVLFAKGEAVVLNDNFGVRICEILGGDSAQCEPVQRRPINPNLFGPCTVEAVGHEKESK